MSSITAIFGALSMLIGGTVLSIPFKGTPSSRLVKRIARLEAEIEKQNVSFDLAMQKVNATKAALRTARAEAYAVSGEIEALRSQLVAARTAKATSAADLDASLPGEI